MKHTSRWWWLPLLLAAPAGAGEVDVTLATTRGTTVRLSEALLKRPAVLFYEDKDSTATNQALKDALFATAKEKGLLDAASVVAVANVAAYDWFPARNIVVAAVKDSERAFGVPIYLDWSGALTQAPWSLKPDDSTVVVLDRKGTVRWTKQGRLTPDEVRDVLRLMGTLIEAR